MSSEWSEYSTYVIEELKRLNTLVENLRGDITKLKVEQAVIKTKATLYGALAGAVPAILYIVVLLSKMKITTG